MAHNLHNSLQTFSIGATQGKFYALSALEKAGLGKISRLPVSIRIVLEAVLRNFDGKKISEDHVKQLAAWQPNAERTDEIPFVVARIVLQDFTGVPLLADLAAMRGVANKMGKNPKEHAQRQAAGVCYGRDIRRRGRRTVRFFSRLHQS